MIIFADKHTDNQTKSNSKAEAPFSTVVCGYSGRGPIMVDIMLIFLAKTLARVKEFVSCIFELSANMEKVLLCPHQGRWQPRHTHGGFCGTR